jgi:hypothetical protein
MGENSLVGGLAVNSNGGEQRGLKPTAVLVGPFQIKVGWIAKVISLAGDGCPAGT